MGPECSSATGLPEVKWGPKVCAGRWVLKKYFKDYVFLLGLAGIIILFDQWTKELVRTRLEVGEIWAPWDWLIPYARIVHWQNTGAAFGMLQSFGGVFAVLAVLVAIAILFYFPQVPRVDWALRLAMVLQFAGAMGNLIDRIAQGGAVTDFVSIGTFPVFNVADASISIGVVVLILGMWIKERSNKPPLSTIPGNSPTQPDSLPKEIKGE